MSVYGMWATATISSAGSSSDEVDLGRDYDLMEIIIPTLTSATIKLQTAEVSGGDYLDLGDGVTTDAGTHNYHDVLKLGGWQYVKVVASATQGTDRLIRVRGMRY